jgi:hypothetical protein
MVALRNYKEVLVTIQRLGNGFKRRCPADKDREDHVRIDDDVAEGEHRQNGWNCRILLSGTFDA